MQRITALGLGALLSALASCGGGQAAAPSAAEPPSDEPRQREVEVGPSDGSSGAVNRPTAPTGCVETRSTVARTATTPLGFSVDELLANVGGAAQVDLGWVGSSLYVQHRRAGATTGLSLSFSPGSAMGTFVDSQGGGCVGHGPCLVCTSRLEVSVDATLKTADHALDEHVQLTLVTSGVGGARFVLDVAAADLAGDYLSGVTPNAGYRLVGLHVEGRFGMGGVPGSRRVVTDTWNGVVAAVVRQDNPRATLDIQQAHGFFPATTGP